MKKLALVLGSLLVVGTAASAKEVMPAPVVVPERVVEIVEKPVIVYRDREVAPAWRPNGSLDMQYRWYGEAEGKSVNEDTDRDWSRGGRTNAGRLQTTANINFTEKQNLNIRLRNYHSLRTDDSTTGKGSSSNADELRIRHHYNFGNLGSSKVNTTSRLEYKQKNKDGLKEVSASVLFDFANYFFSNDYFKVDQFGIRPIYIHQWAEHGNDYSVNKYGLNLESNYTLPFGFSAEFNIKGGYQRLLGDNRFEAGENSLHKGEYYADLELYLYNTTNLYKNGSFAADFIFEGGYDPYSFHQRKVINAHSRVATPQRREYTLYAEPAIKLSYKPTDFVTTYVAAGATYQNWRQTAESSAQNWRWQPTAWAGMKVTF